MYQLIGGYRDENVTRMVPVTLLANDFQITIHFPQENKKLNFFIKDKTVALNDDSALFIDLQDPKQTKIAKLCSKDGSVIGLFKFWTYSTHFGPSQIELEWREFLERIPTLSSLRYEYASILKHTPLKIGHMLKKDDFKTFGIEHENHIELIYNEFQTKQSKNCHVI
jgi:hypothetical protein